MPAQNWFSLSEQLVLPNTVTSTYCSLSGGPVPLPAVTMHGCMYKLVIEIDQQNTLFLFLS